jgi:GNAT superfamily N-acetyltransferase
VNKHLAVNGAGYNCFSFLMVMVFREAKPEDIPQMQILRNSVKENKLSSPGLITDEASLEYITVRGKGWVCEVDERVVGFAIADLVKSNIWALFVDPDFERRGIARNLQRLMLEWYFGQGKNLVWLGTLPGTRAERFYRRSGWLQNGMNGSREIRFEMSRARYLTVKSSL